MTHADSVLAGSYNYFLVALSVLIAILASYAALDLAGRVTSAQGKVRLLWLSGGASAMGLGIWSMHYIGMLAFRLPVPVQYDWPTVLLSLLAAVVASGIALFVVSRHKMGLIRAGLGSILMGGGIATMHYTGMAAMRMAAMCRYSTSLVALSVVLAIVISLVALFLTFYFRGDTSAWNWRKMLSAVVMGAAIPVMHYTGMAAASFTASASAQEDLSHAVSVSSLSTAGITIVTLMVLALVFLSSLADRRFSIQALELESSQRYHQIIEAAFDAFVGMNSEGLITDWNAQAETTFGWSRSEAVGQALSGLIVPHRYREALANGLRHFLATGEGPVLNQRIEISALHREGYEFPVELAISPIRWGGMRLFAAFVRNVRERKRAEQTPAVQYAVTRVLAESATLSEATPKILQAVCEIVNWQLGAIWALNKDARVLRCIDVWRLPTLQLPEFEAITRSVTFRSGQDLPGRVWESCKAAWINDVIQDTSFLRAREAAADNLHTGFAFPVFFREEVTGVVEFFSREIRQPDQNLMTMLGALGSQIGQFIARKEAEELLALQAEVLARSNAELELFAYVASHDLQEPLRMVASYTQLLARRYKGKLGAEADEFIGFAVDGATRMQQLIQDLLSYSRLTSRGKALDFTSAEAACSSALENLQQSIKESNAQVSVAPLPKVFADASQLIQLFQNLIGNAIKYRNERRPEIHVAATPNASEWTFSVQDNGIGIEPQYSERIFQMFQRLHTRKEYSGTGIGLAVCRKIVERHGGRIWVESQPGQGSTFLFTIPRAEETQK